MMCCNVCEFHNVLQSFFLMEHEPHVLDLKFQVYLSVLRVYAIFVRLETRLSSERREQV